MAFLIGLFIGATIGVIAMAVIVAARERNRFEATLADEDAKRWI